jgi:hypothetical protein
LPSGKEKTPYLRLEQINLYKTASGALWFMAPIRILKNEAAGQKAAIEPLRCRDLGA